MIRFLSSFWGFINVRITLGKEPKKADVIEQLELFEHVGLLVNWLPGVRGALYLVIRRFQLD